MWWSKTLLLSSAIILLPAVVHAEKTSCPASLQTEKTFHRLNNVSLFQGPPEQLGELMPDTDKDIVWTLRDYQDFAKEKNLPLYLVCHYQGTEKTITVKVPGTAKKCSAWFGDSPQQFYSSCE